MNFGSEYPPPLIYIYIYIHTYIYMFEVLENFYFHVCRRQSTNWHMKESGNKKTNIKKRRLSVDWVSDKMLFVCLGVIPFKKGEKIECPGTILPNLGLFFRSCMKEFLENFIYIDIDIDR